MAAKRQIKIFDTTLRDGEQPPGASMNLTEKMEIAHALVDLGVDIIEAGFPIASKSPGEAMGKPASMMSTPRSTSAWAISIFSVRFMLAPGGCSPSRSVVSKILICRLAAMMVGFRGKRIRAQIKLHGERGRRQGRPGQHQPRPRRPKPPAALDPRFD